MDNTYTLISRIHQAVNQFILLELKKEGIEDIVPSHGAILIELFKRDGLPMNELALRIDRTPQTVTSLVKKLALQGYVFTEKSSGDGRITCVFLSEKGKRMDQILTRISEDIYKLQYDGLDRQEITVLRKALEKMNHNFSGLQKT